MSFGKMNKIGYIMRIEKIIDAEGFSHDRMSAIACVRMAVEGRHGTEKWVNLSAFSEATESFKFRYVPHLDITTDMFIRLDGIVYDIVSVENIKGKNRYIEVLAKRSEHSIG